MRTGAALRVVVPLLAMSLPISVRPAAAEEGGADEPSIEEMLQVIQASRDPPRGGEASHEQSGDEGKATARGGPVGPSRPGAEGVPGSRRVTKGQMALYRFAIPKGRKGRVIADKSGVLPPAHLQIMQPEAFDRALWPIAMKVIGPTRIVGLGGPSPKLNAHTRETGRFSVEAWFRPANLEQGGPARIVSLSLDASNCNFTLGQSGGQIVFRMRTTQTRSVGTPSLDSPRGTLTGGHVHVVCTFDGTTKRIYVDGKALAVTQDPRGTLRNWSDYHLVVANEHKAERPWLGTLYLAAIYDRALAPAEVRHNFLAGGAMLRKVFQVVEKIERKRRGEKPKKRERRRD